MRLPTADNNDRGQHMCVSYVWCYFRRPLPHTADELPRTLLSSAVRMKRPSNGQHKSECIVVGLHTRRGETSVPARRVVAPRLPSAITSGDLRECPARRHVDLGLVLGEPYGRIQRHRLLAPATVSHNRGKAGRAEGRSRRLGVGDQKTRSPGRARSCLGPAMLQRPPPRAQSKATPCTPCWKCMLAADGILPSST